MEHAHFFGSQGVWLVPLLFMIVMCFMCQTFSGCATNFQGTDGTRRNCRADSTAEMPARRSMKSDQLGATR